MLLGAGPVRKHPEVPAGGSCMTAVMGIRLQHGPAIAEVDQERPWLIRSEREPMK